MSPSRVCLHCAAELTGRITKRYCNANCAKGAYHRRVGRKTRYSGIASGTVGAIGELLISADLLARGLPVFRALSPNSPCDLAVLWKGVLIGIEVRTGWLNQNNGHVYFGKRGSDHADVYGIAVHETDKPHYIAITGAGKSFIAEIMAPPC